MSVRTFGEKGKQRTYPGGKSREQRQPKGENYRSVIHSGLSFKLKYMAALRNAYNKKSTILTYLKLYAAPNGAANKIVLCFEM
jgi:hypothetical protein